MTEWTQTELTSLNRILANLYPMIGDGMRVAKGVGLATAQIAFDNKAINNWFAIVQRAKQETKADALVAFALDENPGDEALLQAKQHAPPPPVEGPATTKWSGAPGQLEKILGDKSTLVPISYLELGVIRAKSVVRIKRADGSSGTGFMTAGGILITNNHVLPDDASMVGAVVQFNYQRTVAGLDAPFEEFSIDPAVPLRTSKDNDWSAVRIKGDASKWGELDMKPMTVKVGDRVNIIQHPGGAQKQISFVANVVAFVGGGRVQYLTDTLPGSSGSPVFDTDWNLIALHHSGGWLTEPNAATKSTYYRNEGIAIDTIIQDLAAKPV
ncbi:trypsin-like peptidase domain-containing protein [Mesorhizobium caraganae]|uniref:trypsin-like peptidase domain-containing protein n=1 Tax=Mesorhizobium caraganae TaxID=483206 RepID=UPI00177CA373|nr:trypsin-like peptidase domain-containing protein [Mesorhizobium caraganae]MBM2711715.1 trypsin-like peptidase domain-containing protein [Mesorhizobium caraganae]